jgi:putative transposase
VKGCSVSALCRLCSITRQAYYREKRVRHREGFDQELVLELVRSQRANHPRMGARKLLVEIAPQLAKGDVQVGRDRFLQMLRKHHLLVVPKKVVSDKLCLGRIGFGFRFTVGPSDGSS